MSHELLDLVREGTNRPVRWQDVILTDNVAAIPPVNETPGDFVWNRGFNLVVLNRWGRPLYFCKCRAANDTRLAHEGRSMTALRRIEDLQPYVPRVTEVQSERLRVMITQFLPGIPLNGLLDGKFTRRMVPMVHQAMEGITKLSGHSTAFMAELVEGPTDHLLETDGALRYLANVGLSPQDAVTLRAVVNRASPLPHQLQHGDLWPANVIRSGAHLWFIDFEMFGNVQVPMYDVFHFLRTCTDFWATREEVPWTVRMLEETPATHFVRQCAARAAYDLGLDTSQALAALVFYVVHFSATTHKRNPEGTVWKSFFQEVQALAAAVRQYDAALARRFLQLQP